MPGVLPSGLESDDMRIFRSQIETYLFRVGVLAYWGSQNIKENGAGTDCGFRPNRTHSPKMSQSLPMVFPPIARHSVIGASLFAEEADAVKNTFLGNTPLLFAHVEYVRSVVELNRARAAQPKAKHYDTSK